MSSQTESQQEKQLQADPDNLPCTPVKGLNWRRYERITGGMTIGAYVVTVSYATAVILVGCAPWNILLILGLLLSRDEVLRDGISSRWGRAS
jgi:hypothetical protein